MKNDLNVFTLNEHDLRSETALMKVTRWNHTCVDFWKNAPFHSHEFIEFVFVMDGNAIHQIKNEKKIISTSVSKGDVLCIWPGEEHSYFFSDNQKHLVVNNLIVSPELMKSDFAQVYITRRKNYVNDNRQRTCSERMFNLLHLQDDELFAISQKLNAIDEEIKNSSQHHIDRQALLLILFLLDLDEYYFRRSDSKHDYKYDIVSKAMMYINNYYMEHISVDDISNDVCCSRRTLERYFQQTIGTSINEVLNIQRIKYACNLLIESDQKIANIAMSVGIDNISRFNFLFKRQTGLTPRQFRMQNRKSNN